MSRNHLLLPSFIVLTLIAAATACKKENTSQPAPPYRDTLLYSRNVVFDSARIDYTTISESPNYQVGQFFITEQGKKDSQMVRVMGSLEGPIVLTASDTTGIPPTAEVYAFDEGYKIQNEKIHAIFFKTPTSPTLTFTGLPAGGTLTIKKYTISYDVFQTVNRTKEEHIAIMTRHARQLASKMYTLYYYDSLGVVPGYNYPE